MPLSAYYDSDHRLTIHLDDITDSPLDGATVNVTVYKNKGTVEAPGTWPAAMTGVGGGTGDYTVDIDAATFAEALHSSLVAHVVATAAGKKRTARLPVVVAPDLD